MTGSDNLDGITEKDEEESSNTSDEDDTSSEDDMFEGQNLKKVEKDMNDMNS